jgi:predicted TIM-barrel fold metal-dependent hydrolase
MTVTASAEAPYSRGVRMMDADSHIMEPPTWLDEYADPSIRERLHPLTLDGGGILAEMRIAVEEAAQRAQSPEAVAALEERLLTAKNWRALGAWDPAERSRALDMLGFEHQLVFATFGRLRFIGLDREMEIGGHRALNRGMNDFCSSDARLHAVASVPRLDPETTLSIAEEALDGGARAVMFSQIPGDISPTHPDFDVVWARLEERRIPFMLHITHGTLLHPSFLNNGHPTEDPFGENIRSKEYMAVHQRAEQFLSSMVLDGVFEAHPGLMGGCIELSALWVVSWLRQLDQAQRLWGKGDETLARLPMKPSEYVHRNLFFTPFFGEPVGWMIEQASEDLFLFSSDYPHREGTTDPIGHLEETMDTLSESARSAFYYGNYSRMMGL